MRIERLGTLCYSQMLPQAVNAPHRYDHPRVEDLHTNWSLPFPAPPSSGEAGKAVGAE